MISNPKTARPKSAQKRENKMHSFTNRHQTPLTIDQIAQRAPSALAVRPYAEMSTKYAYIPTLQIIEGLASGT
jgi:hypothetical protein